MLGKLVALETAAQVSQTLVSLGFGEDGAQASSTPSAFLEHGVKGSPLGWGFGAWVVSMALRSSLSR